MFLVKKCDVLYYEKNQHANIHDFIVFIIVKRVGIYLIIR